jgi:LAS superfamily LD-carboxypeptidase LdcB
LYRTIKQLFLFPIICACLNAADSLPSITPPAAIEKEALPAAIEEQALPTLQGRAISEAILNLELSAVRRALMLAGCKVAPLPEIDPEALTFEQNAESAPADLQGLMPDTAQALDTFKELVASVGGTFELKSAYRAPAYQAHLHDVWVKWVKELRNNRTAGCRALREEVGAEFKRHQLLVKQQPVPASDHALGLAFDAAIALPPAARLNRRRVTVDKLAALAGIKRPNGRRDPVHFKLLSERLIAD